MKITLAKPEMTNCWIVEAHGYSGDGDADNREQVYVGTDEAMAKRTHLEVLALSRAFPHGRGGSDDYCYTRLVRPLFKDVFDEDCEALEGFDPSAPFGWAAQSWSLDVTSHACLDATIRGSDLFWVDEHGAKLAAKVELTDEERKILNSASPAREPDRFPIEGIMAKLLALDLQAEINDPKRFKGPASL